uniref:sister-chromatid cohesion protein 3 isoform X2 n=1 Tax=Fragaria vesca subsp. vesca TaxID=101020 RepID=UPI0005C921F1|nr:PREDICTED: sister-chromatid cohesion protein 3 isoform X2 [Fragaria vesca subsp. vesca]
MEEPAPAGRPKRTRAQSRFTTENNNGGDASEHVDRESSPDDFEAPRPKAKRGRPPSGPAAAPPKASALTLIEVVKGNGKLIPQAVKLWVERYEKDAKPATVELLTMLFEACGAKYHIKEELLDETNVDDVVVALVELARNGNVDDYQSSKKEFKNIKDNLQSFWDKLVCECQHGPLFDQILFEKCMGYIIALSCTPPRVYRQTATLMGLQLVTSFITVAKTLGLQRETTRRQLEAEKKKQSEGPRVESLNKRFSTTHENITLLEQMMRNIFQGLFVHRYRDIEPNIRTSCIEALGVWILSYPSMFLQDLYLKYLGWTLNDKNAGVRKASVLALQNLYEVDDNVPTLGLFTERFSTRMIELADDIDISVAVCAIGLVKQLLRHQLLPDDDLGPLYDLLIDDPAEIRHAIGALVYEHLISQKFISSQSGAKGVDNNSSEVQLGRMLQILREFSADPILSVYVIDDVWEYMNAMKDWKCIISMLLDENPLIELTDEDATNLVRLLCASVKKAVGERIVPATDNRKPYYTKAQKDVFEHNKQDITLAMMKNYPLLLRKFMADKAKIPSLVDIILHMNLGLYSKRRQEQNFETVIQLIKEAFFKHGEKEALRSCANAIMFCSTDSQGELKDTARNLVKELHDELIHSKLKPAMKEVADGGDEYPLLVNLKRMYELQLSGNVPIESLYEDMVSTLQSYTNKDDQVVTFLLLNMYMHVQWCLHAIIHSPAISEASLSSLLAKRDFLSERLEYLLSSCLEMEGNRCNQLARWVCVILTDLSRLFKKTNFSSSKLEKLGYSPDASVLQKFWKLSVQQLSISDDTEDDDGNKEYIEETNRDTVMMAAVRLAVTDKVYKEYLGPEIISRFMMHGTTVAEIVKHLITFLKKNDDDLAKTFLEALKMAYHRYMVELSRSDDESLASKHFLEFQELAAQLSGTFVGVSKNKHKSDILKIVNQGIDYAFIDTPKQLSFLEGAVLQFVSKLPTPDILEINVNIQKRTENVNMDEDPSGWRPYHTFVQTLREKFAKIEEEKDGTSVRRRGRPRKRRNIQGKRLFDDHGSSEEEDSISGSDHENAQDEEEQQDEDEDDDDDEDEDVPLINQIRSSSKLRSRGSREGNKGQTQT